MTALESPSATPSDETLPRWNVTDVHASLDARSFVDAMERSAADVDRLVTLFDELDIRAQTPRAPVLADGTAADRAIDELNRVSAELAILRVYAYSIVSTDSRDAPAQSALGETRQIDATLRPLTARLADWVASLGVDDLDRDRPFVRINPKDHCCHACPPALPGTDRDGEAGIAATSRAVPSWATPRQRCPAVRKPEVEPHPRSRWAAQKRAFRRTPGPSLA